MGVEEGVEEEEGSSTPAWVMRSAMDFSNSSIRLPISSNERGSKRRKREEREKEKRRGEEVGKREWKDERNERIERRMK